MAHALERLWIARSRLAADRSFCQSRHSMHFFVSNLLYYLQVLYMYYYSVSYFVLLSLHGIAV